MVGDKDSVRGRMALNETIARGLLRWKIEMRFLTASLARDTPSDNTFRRKYRWKGKRPTGKGQTFLSISFYSVLQWPFRVRSVAEAYAL